MGFGENLNAVLEESSTAVGGESGAGRDRGAVGRSVRRKEDLRLLTGASKFIDDLNRPGALRACILHYATTERDVAALVDIVRRTGAALG